jgi:hypothetical protein
MSSWEWVVAAYYNDTVKLPKKPGELAMKTVHKDDVGKDIEVSVFNKRDDIGEVIVSKINRR